MKEAINIAFDMDFQISQINDTKGLPFYMLSKRQFYRMNGAQISFVMVKLQNDERFGVIALDKQRKGQDCRRRRGIGTNRKRKGCRFLL